MALPVKVERGRTAFDPLDIVRNDLNMLNRFFGPYKFEYWALLTCNGLIPQLFWFHRFRTSVPVLFA